jgi:hypothetical protein
MSRFAGFLWVCVLMLVAGGCKPPVYDRSSPQAALDSMYKMIADGRPELIGQCIYIEPRDISYSDGVTEASAIQNVTDKAGQMIGQLYRVALKLRERYPEELQKEFESVKKQAQRDDLDEFARFLADPFGLIDANRSRLTVEDMGDGTAAILFDGKPPFGYGMLMRDVEGEWKVDVPIDLLQNYRPNTREEWQVFANTMLSLERSLTAFEDELDRGELRDLRQASSRAGRLLGERAFVQGLIYQNMKRQARQQQQQPASG